MDSGGAALADKVVPVFGLSDTDTAREEAGEAGQCLGELQPEVRVCSWFPSPTPECQKPQSHPRRVPSTTWAGSVTTPEDKELLTQGAGKAAPGDVLGMEDSWHRDHDVKRGLNRETSQRTAPGAALGPSDCPQVPGAFLKVKPKPCCQEGIEAKTQPGDIPR